MINSLISFRFIIAFIIFILHCKIYLGLQFKSEYIDKFFSNGATFMTGFFVLSGFIMHYVYNKYDFGIRANIFTYYKKRFAKIYPTYIFATYVYFLVFNIELLDFPEKIIINDIFLTQAFFPSVLNFGINTSTWSISAEMFLYFLFPFLLILFKNNLRYLVTTTIILLAIISTNLISKESTDHIYSNPICRIPDFLCGACSYMLLDKFKKKYMGILHFFSIISLIIISTLYGEGQHMKSQFFLAPLFACWIYCAFHSKSFIYNNKILVFLGRISYSFYLWQYLILQFGKIIIYLTGANIIYVTISCFLANITISIASYYLIEESSRLKILKFWKIS